MKGDVDIEIKLDRLSHNYNRAQYVLDTSIMQDIIPFMPRYTNTFINTTAARSAAVAGTGVVVAAAPPEGRFLYMGKVMVGIYSRSAWAKKGEKKEVINKNLVYANGRQSHWFEPAKERHGRQWVKKVKEEVGRR